MSLAESLMNAIAHGRVHGVQFKRGATNDRQTFADLNAVIDRNIDGAKEAARVNGMESVGRHRSEIEERARNEERREVCAWLRGEALRLGYRPFDEAAERISRGEHIKVQR